MKHEFVADKITHLTSGSEHIIQFHVHKDHTHYIRHIVKGVEGELRVVFKTNKETRSDKQNRLLWAVISEISDAVNFSHTESETMKIYRDYIKEANIKFHRVATPKESVDFLREQYRALEVIGETQTARGHDLVTVKLYPGSSQFDKEEMSRFIEIILRDASSLGIETSNTTELRRYRHEK